MTETTIVFLHGASLGGWMWQDIVENLSQFKCITLNLPEHGADKTLFSLESSVDSIHKLIQKQDAPVHIVGISLGALVGLELIRQYPQDTQSAILSSTSLGALPAGAVLTALSSPLAWLSTRNFAIKQAAKQMNLPAKMYAQFEADLKQMSGAMFKRINETIDHYQPEEKTYSLENPILIVCGENEPNFVKQNQLRLKSKLGLDSAYQVTDSGHAWCFEHPKLFADTVRAWIQHDSLPKELKPL